MSIIDTRTISELLNAKKHSVLKPKETIEQIKHLYDNLIELLRHDYSDDADKLNARKIELSEYEKITISPETHADTLFNIPSYQRGYRWTQTEINHLLNDIKDFANQEEGWYCLQPIVVKSTEHDGSTHAYDLIDGQQRLTTIFLIAKYLNLPSKLSLQYTTRERSREFLQTVTAVENNENVDFYHISRAYITITHFFENLSTLEKQIFTQTFTEKTRVIWYEIDSSMDAIDAFSRLNMGKIRLSNAELVKAKLLSENNGLNKSERGEIAREWDNIEKALHENDFWSFVSGSANFEVGTRIDKLLEIYYELEGHKSNSDEFALFDHFKIDHWEKIIHYFETLWSWYKDNDLYHRIAYLIILSSSREIISLLKEYKDKKSLNEKINEKIRVSITALELDGDRDGNGVINGYHEDPYTIKNALTLLNILISKNSTLRYPLHLHLSTVTWSLEHIYAQNSKLLEKPAEWINWKDEHLAIIKEAIININNQEHSAKLVAIKDKLNIFNYSEEDKVAFELLYTDTTKLLSDLEIIDSDMHNIDNLALINQSHNSSLGNNSFNTKRQMIIERAANGEFIPPATIMIFNKSFTKSHIQSSYWSHIDRADYTSVIKEILAPYLPS